MADVQIIRLNARNDTNGNPRRVFVVLEAGRAVAAFDEGYSGTHAIPEAVRHLYQGQTFDTTATERRDLLKITPDAETLRFLHTGTRSPVNDPPTLAGVCARCGQEGHTLEDCGVS